jgi:hypothetical protein
VVFYIEMASQSIVNAAGWPVSGTRMQQTTAKISTAPVRTGFPSISHADRAQIPWIGRIRPNTERNRERS